MMWISSTFLLLLFFCFVVGLNLTLNEPESVSVDPTEEASTPDYEISQDLDETEQHVNHVTLGILVDLHDGTSETQDEEMRNDSVPGVLCGSLNIAAFQQLAAVRWATEFINEKTDSTEYGLDVVVHDTCGENGIAMSETYQLIEWAKENIETPLVGVIVIGSRNNERIIDKPLEILSKENISAIVTSSRAAELLLSKHHNVFTTAPDISSVTEAIVFLIRELESSSIAVISSCSHAMKKFEKIASERSVPVQHFSLLEKDNLNISENVLQFLEGEASTSKTVVLLLEPNELDRLLRSAKNLTEFQNLVDQKLWIIGSVGMNEQLIHDWSIKLKSKLFIVQPHIAPNPDFNMYFLENLKGALSAEPSEMTQEYIERTYDCEWLMNGDDKEVSKSPSVVCNNLTSANLLQKFHPEPDVSFIVSAVSAYSAALRLAQLKTCKDVKEDEDCDISQMSTSVIDALRTFNFPIKVTEGLAATEGPDVISTASTIATEHELEGTRGRINHQGKLVSRKYNILYSEPTQRISRVGQFSSERGLVMDASFTMPIESQQETFHKYETSQEHNNDIEVESETGKIPFTRRRAGKKAISDDDHLLYESAKHGLSLQQMEDEMLHKERMSPEFYISRIWALVVVAIGITGVFLALYMLVYVLLKMCDGTLHGNQTFGILLLLCVMILYSSVVLFVLPPGNFLCNLRVFLPSIALAISFGILLLKAMQLRSLVSLGLGGRISIFNQFVTLIFIVAVQLAINLQWYLSPHEIEDAQLAASLKNDCSQPHLTYLLLHSYIGLLIIFVFLYGTSVLKIRRNFNEARWVTLTSLFSLPIIIGWTVVVLFGPPDYQEPASSISFLSFATVILFIIFVPKLGTISKQGSLSTRKTMLQQAGPGYSGSISTIFTTLGSDRGGGLGVGGTLQSQKRNNNHSHLHSSYYSSSAPSPLPPPPATLLQPYSAHNHNHHHHHLRSHSHSNNNTKCVTYSPRVTSSSHVFNSPSTSSSMAKSTTNMKTPFFSSHGGGAYP